MQESCPYGSVRGAPSNGCPYRNRQIGSASAPVRPMVWARPVRPKDDPRKLLMSGVRQIINSRATPRASISKSSPCTGGRAKCHVKPPEMAPRRTNSLAHERMEVKDRIDLGCGHIRPAEAERRHTLLHRPEHETRFLAHRLGRLVAAPNARGDGAAHGSARLRLGGCDRNPGLYHLRHPSAPG